MAFEFNILEVFGEEGAGQSFFISSRELSTGRGLEVWELRLRAHQKLEGRSTPGKRREEDGDWTLEYPAGEFELYSGMEAREGFRAQE